MAGWFGELYRETTEPLLDPRLAGLEAEVIARLLGLRRGERVLDLGCGHGRHLRALARRGLALVGVDRDAGSLRGQAPVRPSTSGRSQEPGDEAGPPLRTNGPPLPLALSEGPAEQARSRRATPLLVRADLRDLPFGPTFDAAYSWYSSLFLWDDAANARALAELARVVRPRGRLLVQHANPFRLAREPVARAVRALPGGGQVEEESRYHAAAGVELLQRTMRRQGRVLAGEVRLRYYRPTEWEALADGAGLRLRSLGSTGPGVPVPFTEEAEDLIAVLEKPT